MIVPAMNWQEILKEFKIDSEIVSRKAQYIYDNKIRRRIVKEKLTNCLIFNEYITPNRNLWLIIVVITHWKIIPKLFPVCIFNDYKGINAMYGFDILNHSNLKGLVRFSTHCITRYRSRLKLDISQSLKVIEHICRNILSNRNVLKQIELKEEVVHIYMPVTGGGFLGFYHNENYIVDLRTFISDELMRSDQIQKAMKMRNMKEEDFPDFNL